jgi:hypothetical protein
MNKKTPYPVLFKRQLLEPLSGYQMNKKETPYPVVSRLQLLGKPMSWGQMNKNETPYTLFFYWSG